MGLFPSDTRSEGQKIEDAKKLLLEKGYLVRGPIQDKWSVNNLNSLVRFFYDTLEKYKPTSVLSYSGVPSRDRKIAKKFLQSRMDLGVSKNRAFQECCEIIEFLFKHEKSLGIKFPITSMTVLAQGDSCGWITELVINAYNNNNKKIREIQDEIFFDNLYSRQESEVTSDKVSKTLEFLEEVLNSYGKEKKD